MSAAREEILSRARRALGDIAPVPVQERVPPSPDGRSVDVLLDLFADRVRDYRATVSSATGHTLAPVIVEILARHGAARVVAPAGLAVELGAAVLRVPDQLAPTSENLEPVDGVVTGCALAIAETGTIVLDAGPDQGPRILTLLPDLHVCVVRSEQIVGGVAEALDVLAPAPGTKAPPMTFISGPSATSDIELERVEGVHGPRRLEVIVLRS
jgi:L-lactate dehydrogenase complex protein LldG